MPKLRLEVEFDVSDTMVPDELKGDMVATVRKLTVLDLLRRRKLTQSRAAQLLGISRAELFDLMAEAGVSQMDLRPGEVERDAAQALEDYKRAGL